MRLVMFDLDNTLLEGDSDYQWGQFLIEKGVLDREKHEKINQSFYDAYNTGTLNIDKFLSYQLGNLALHSHTQLVEWRKEFMLRKIKPIISEKARQLVKSFEQDQKIIITATNSFITRPIADEFGVGELIATDPQMVGGEFNGLVEGVPAFSDGKVQRLEKWLAENQLDFSIFSETWFYSDSINDLPLLSKVSNPVAVDPDKKLREHSLDKNWTIISLR